MKIIPATTPEHLRQVGQLFEEYEAALSTAPCFTHFRQELDGLPGDYAPPEGRLWLAATHIGEPVGCVGLRRLSPEIGEMKRLYVRPAYRAQGLGKELAQTVLETATAMGFLRLRLETTAAMATALRLYETLGFTPIAPARPDVIALELELGSDPHLQMIPVGEQQVDLVAPLFDAYRQFYGQTQDLAGATRFLRERLRLGQSVIFAALIQGQAVGFTQLYPSFSSVSMKPIWILNDLYVDDKARRRRVGARLLRVACEHARRTGAVRVELATAVTNHAAQTLYEREGWRRDVEFVHYDHSIPEAALDAVPAGKPGAGI